MPPDSAGAPPVVLIADNDAAVSALLTEVLTRQGIVVRHAFDGEAAVLMARAPEVRVMVCDIDMPRLSGAEVVEALGGMSKPPAVLVVTGFLEAATLERLRRSPLVRDVLRKPFDLMDFAGRVRLLLRAAAQPATMPTMSAVPGSPER